MEVLDPARVPGRGEGRGCKDGWWDKESRRSGRCLWEPLRIAPCAPDVTRARLALPAAAVELSFELGCLGPVNEPREGHQEHPNPLLLLLPALLP